VIAGRNVLDAVASTIRALVPEHGRRVAGWVGAGRRVEVGMPDAAGGEAHEHLARVRVGEIDFLDCRGAPAASRTAARVRMG
jgi:hypothetical protein